jgi:D-arabinose 1-dehydrogenase-like Zn-dependent alcohol dehydrogenase
LRPILRKSLLIESNQTGTKEDIFAALELARAGRVKSEFEVLKLNGLNEGLDRVKTGDVRGKLVVAISK